MTLFHNGRIHLRPGDPDGRTVETLVVRGGLVVGTSLAEAGLPPDAPVRRVDLRGGTAIPGLQDAHGHVSSLGETLETVALGGLRSYEEVVERIASAATTLPPGTWITGRGWDQTLWPGARFPHHAALSERVPDHPVLVRRVDGHAALANARALELAGLLDARPVPELEGGRVDVDAQGAPTGVLIDTAMGLVARRVPPPDRATLRRRILAAQEALLAVGLVCVHDMGMDPLTVDVLSELEDEGRLALRIVAYLYANQGLPAELAQRFPRARDRDPRAKLRVLGAKLMLDGALGSRGAALLAPYADAPDEEGLLRMDAEAFRARLSEVAAAGLQPATHAIGDRANRIVLDAYAARLASDPAFAGLRPRVEHAQVVAPADWERFAARGIVASMQPTHATSDMRWAEARLGPERVRGAYAWRRLGPEPRRLAFGSDFPVESPDPLEGLYAACTRQDREGRPEGGWTPDQRLVRREALAAFTEGAARAAREEALRGHLEPGAAADLTVLDVDPLEVAPAALLDATVLLTVVDGEVVHTHARDTGSR